jgi:hypothetical protein
MHLFCVHHSYLWFAQLAQYSSHGYSHLVSRNDGGFMASSRPSSRVCLTSTFLLLAAV